MARLYRETFNDVKAEKEYDYNESLRIHNKYSYLYEKDSLDNRVPTEKYDLNNERPDLDEQIFTTELSDEGIDLMYKRYKMMQVENTDLIRDLEADAKELLQKYSTGSAVSSLDPE
jgi:hypothetical protein